MSRGTIVLGGQLSGGTNVWGDKCPGGTDVLGGHLSRGTNVGGTIVRGTNVTPPSKDLTGLIQHTAYFQNFKVSLSLVSNSTLRL